MKSKIKALLLVLDGLGDYVHPNYGKTPLMMGKKKYFKIMEREAETGLMQPLLPGLPVGSDTGHLALFGYDPFTFYHGRGPFEAVGSGLEMSEDDIAFRLNFATYNNGKVVDRRAGRVDFGFDELAKDLQYENEYAKFIVKHTTEHRGVLVIKPKKIKLGDQIEDFDSEFSSDSTLRFPRRLNDDSSNKWTEKLVQEFIKRAIKILKTHPVNDQREKRNMLRANIVLLRGCGKYVKLPSVTKSFGITMACVAGGALYKGVAKMVGMFTPNIPGATGDKHTNILSKVTHAIQLSKKYDVIFMHLKATDSFGHDGDFKGKMNFISKIDSYLEYLMRAFDVILITADHSTPVTVKHHTGDPVPIMLWAKKELGITRPDKGKFDEFSNGLIRVNGTDVLRLIRNKISQIKKFGE